MDILDTNGDNRVVQKVSIWIAVLVAVLGSVYWIGRMDCTNSYNKKALDSLGGLLKQQAVINSENLNILDAQNKQDAQQIRVTEAIKHAREQAKNKPVIYIDRGDIRLLNASRRNQRPDVISPWLTAEEKRAASTVTEQALISASIECSAKYNQCASKRNALIDIVENFMEKQNELICK